MATGQQRAARTAARKWGDEVMELGFCIVPSLLLQAQGRLGLNPTQLAILLQICEHWWEGDNKPYPGKKRLADRLGIGPRQIQRHIAELEDAGLVERIERHGVDGRRQTNIYDLSGLVTKLGELAPEFRQVRDNARDARRRVAKRGYRLEQP